MSVFVLVGQMEKYDNKWIMNGTKTCETNASSPATLGLSNMAGKLFVLALSSFNDIITRD